MKSKTSVAHDEVMVRKLRKDRTFAAEYLKAAMEDTDEPQVLLIALRQIADAPAALPRSPRRRESSGKASTAPCRLCGNPRLSTLFAVTKAMGLNLTVEAGAAQR